MEREFGDPGEDDVIDSQIASAIKCTLVAESEDFVRPSQETIEAYLLGHATERQRGEMLRALSRSASFRSEMLELAEDLQVIEAGLTRHYSEEIPVSQPQEHVSAASPPQANGKDRPKGTGPPFLMFITRFMLNPAIAYSLLLVALSYPAYEWLSGRNQEVVPPAGTDQLPAAQTNPLKPHLVGLGAGNIGYKGQSDADTREVVEVFQIPPGPRPLEILARISEPVPNAKGAYVVTISDGDGEVSRLALDTGAIADIWKKTVVRVPVPAGRLDSDTDYTLTVSYSEAGHALDGQQLAKERFRLQVAPNPSKSRPTGS